MGMLDDFKKFALRGNLVDMAIGFTVGAAFTSVAKSAVDDLVMPVIGLFTGGADFSDLFLVLSEGAKAGAPYGTLRAAQEAGAVTLNYGLFVNAVLAFLLVAAVMFLVIRMMNRLEERLEAEFGDDAAKPDEPSQKKCPFCRTEVPYRAIRCPHCTSELERVAADGA
jgi:large conductance mechanosensitive channel